MDGLRIGNVKRGGTIMVTINIEAMIFLWHNQNFVSEFSTSIRNSFVNRDKFRAKFIFNCFAQRLMLEYKKGVIVIIVILGHTRTVELLIYLAKV